MRFAHPTKVHKFTDLLVTARKSNYENIKLFTGILNADLTAKTRRLIITFLQVKYASPENSFLLKRDISHVASTIGISPNTLRKYLKTFSSEGLAIQHKTRWQLIAVNKLCKKYGFDKFTRKNGVSLYTYIKIPITLISKLQELCNIYLVFQHSSRIEYARYQRKKTYIKGDQKKHPLSEFSEQKVFTKRTFETSLQRFAEIFKTSKTQANTILENMPTAFITRQQRIRVVIKCSRNDFNTYYAGKQAKRNGATYYYNGKSGEVYYNECNVYTIYCNPASLTVEDFTSTIRNPVADPNPLEESIKERFGRFVYDYTAQLVAHQIISEKMMSRKVGFTSYNRILNSCLKNTDAGIREFYSKIIPGYVDKDEYELQEVERSSVDIADDGYKRYYRYKVNEYRFKISFSKKMKTTKTKLFGIGQQEIKSKINSVVKYKIKSKLNPKLKPVVNPMNYSFRNYLKDCNNYLKGKH